MGWEGKREKRWRGGRERESRKREGGGEGKSEEGERHVNIEVGLGNCIFKVISKIPSRLMSLYHTVLGAQ